MATKRGICPYCGTKKDTYRYFLINPEATICYCPNCMKEVEPQVAINNYNEYIVSLNNKADDTLFVTCDPALAYQEYADIIELDESITHAYFGRLLCLIYMSKVRKSYIPEAMALLSEEAPVRFRKMADMEEYVSFLRRINKVVDDYEFAMRKRLCFRKYFYDTDCLKLYLFHINEILKFKDLLLEEAKVIVKKAKKEDAEVLRETLEHNIEEKNILFKETDHITVDGRHYRFIKVRRNGEVEIEDVTKRKTNTFASRYRMATLNPEDKKLRFIKDLIFKDYTRIIASINRSLVFLILLGVIIAACAALVGIFYSKQNIFYYLGIVLGGASFIGFVTLFIFRLTWKRMVMKRKMEIY